MFVFRYEFKQPSEFKSAAHAADLVLRALPSKHKKKVLRTMPSMWQGKSKKDVAFYCCCKLYTSALIEHSSTPSIDKRSQRSHHSQARACLRNLSYNKMDPRQSSVPKSATRLNKIVACMLRIPLALGLLGHLH